MSLSHNPATHLERQEQNAIRLALQNFRYFVRELMWDSQRPESKLAFAGVLCSFSEEQDGSTVTEQIWLSGIICDGFTIQGQAATAPAKLTTIQAGGSYQVNLKELEDWLYVYEGKAYGGYGIQLQRSRMDDAERRRYDATWGFDFGDPLAVTPYPVKEAEPEQSEKTEDPDAPAPTKFFGMTIKPRGKKAKSQEDVMPEVNPRNDHEMAIFMENDLRAYYQTNPIAISSADAWGRVPLHVHALSGNRNIVKILLELGANASELTASGHSAKDLAKALGWAEVVTILNKAERGI